MPASRPCRLVTRAKSSCRLVCVRLLPWAHAYPPVTRLAAIALVIGIFAAAAHGGDWKRTSLFDAQWLDAVVSIELAPKGEEARPVGTGFLISTEGQHVLLITAKHVVFKKDGTLQSGLGYRLNETNGPSVLIDDAQLVREGYQGWFASRSSDLACRFIAWRTTTKLQAIPKDRFLERKAVDAGAPLLVLGFPLGLRSASQSNPVAKHGVVARSDSDGLIADVLVFPGNSGGPVLYVPQLKVGAPLSSPLVNQEMLIGMVINYIPYIEPAMSAQSGRPRVVFEENSGLANVVPTDAMVELLESSDVRELDGALPTAQPSPRMSP